MKSLTPVRNAAVRSDVQYQVCDERETKPVYAYVYGEKTSEILQCCRCGHLFIHPVPLVTLNDRNMDTLPDAEFFGNNFLKFLHENIVINKEVRIVKAFLPEKAPRLFDIGCGTGWATSLWQKRGFDVTGLEPSPVRSKVARETYRLNVSSEHLENFVIKDLFDVIVLRHLLEHIEEPAKMLTKIKSFLKPGRLLVIVIPNINCIGRYLFRDNWEWILPWHLHFYTPKTLSRLLEKVGYEKCRIYQMPSPLWYPHALNKALFGENAEFQIPHRIALIFCVPIVLLGVLLNINDNMTLIFRNVSPSESQ